MQQNNLFLLGQKQPRWCKLTSRERSHSRHQFTIWASHVWVFMQKQLMQFLNQKGNKKEEKNQFHYFCFFIFLSGRFFFLFLLIFGEIFFSCKCQFVSFRWRPPPRSRTENCQNSTASKKWNIFVHFYSRSKTSWLCLIERRLGHQRRLSYKVENPSLIRTLTQQGSDI